MSNRRTLSEIAKTKTAEDLAKRDAAIAVIEKNPKLKAVYEEERDAYSRQGEGNVLFHWDRGRHALEVKRNAEYGESAIDTLADALMVDRSTMYKTATIGAMFPTRELLVAKMEAAQARDFRLLSSHLFLVVHVPEAKSGDDVHANRMQMIDLIIQHRLTVRAAHEEIKSRYTDDPHGSEDDAPVAPKSLGGVLKRIGTTADKTLARLDESFTDVSGRLELTTAARVKDADLEFMDADAEKLTALAQKANEAARALKQGAARLRREKRALPAAEGTPQPEPQARRRPGGDPRARRPAAAGARR